MGLVAESYDSALAFLHSYDPQRSGCLVLDVRMPDMSGLELAQTLREREVVVPVILITGHGDVPMAVRAMQLGAINKVIAADLGVSQRTVEIHRSHIMEKMQTHSVAELVRLVLKVRSE